MALLLSLLAIFGDAYGTYRFDRFRYFTISVFLFTIVIVLKRHLRAKNDIRGLSIAITAYGLCLLSYPFWISMYNAYAYGGILIAVMLFRIDRKLLDTALIVLLILSLFMGVYEFFTKTYLFINEVVKNDQEFIYDMKTMGGLAGVIRAKAFFYGCLSLGMFALGTAFFFSRNTRILLLCMIVAIIAGNRVAIILILCLILINPSIKMQYRIFFIPFFLCLLVIGLFFLSIYDFASYERIVTVFDMGTDANTIRLLLWKNGFEQFASYDVLHMLVGNNGLFFSIETNNPESGWITLLTDTGLLGFLLYFIPLVRLFIRFIERKQYYMASVILLFFCANFPVTFCLSMTSNLVYWFCMLKFDEILDKEKEGAYSTLDCQDNKALS